VTTSTRYQLQTFPSSKGVRSMWKWNPSTTHMYCINLSEELTHAPQSQTSLQVGYVLMSYILVSSLEDPCHNYVKATYSREVCGPFLLFRLCARCKSRSEYSAIVAITQFMPNFSMPFQHSIQ